MVSMKSDLSTYSETRQLFNETNFTIGGKLASNDGKKGSNF